MRIGTFGGGGGGGGGAAVAGTVTVAPHPLQRAERPAYVSGTLKALPQLPQEKQII
jgi:hypothetical protein